MLLHADREKLLELAKNFYGVCHTMISIYDANKKSICSYPDKMCAFCSEIRKSPKLSADCIRCDEIALEKCLQTRKPYSYNCHMGLIEVAVPIIQQDIVIGYILFGQITDRKDKGFLTKEHLQAAKNGGADPKLLRKSSKLIKYRSPQYITSISRLTEMCANYIWQNSFIRIKKDTTAHALDSYLRENLRNKLTLENLCKYFGVSRSTLYSISKEYFGCGVSEYVTRLRIDAAKRLLREGLTVNQTAEQVGIADVNYFVRLFKSKEGTTPKQYSLSKR